MAHKFLGDLQISFIAPNNQEVFLQSCTLGRCTKNANNLFRFMLATNNSPLPLPLFACTRCLLKCKL
ncbi:hypothetical protein [Scytonema sp. HK-05]|uniref:hypothetical protein n=1 Tax=Scytonema sp. HK-05 TaxID=1137095 RepID=UPI00116147FD